jgi:hypothetical protein
MPDRTAGQTPEDVKGYMGGFPAATCPSLRATGAGHRIILVNAICRVWLG